MTEERDQPASGRFAGLGWRSAAIAGAAAAIGIIGLVALSDPAPESERYTISASEPAPVSVGEDPLRVELARCRTLPANSDDVGCRAAWEVNRRRFMGESRSFVPPTEAALASAPAVPAPASSIPVAPPLDTQTTER